jgi:hypothetical protein
MTMSWEEDRWHRVGMSLEQDKEDEYPRTFPGSHSRGLVQLILLILVRYSLSASIPVPAVLQLLRPSIVVTLAIDHVVTGLDLIYLARPP